MRFIHFFMKKPLEATFTHAYVCSSQTKFVRKANWHPTEMSKMPPDNVRNRETDKIFAKADIDLMSLIQPVDQGVVEYVQAISTKVVLSRLV